MNQSLCKRGMGEKGVGAPYSIFYAGEGRLSLGCELGLRYPMYPAGFEPANHLGTEFESAAFGHLATDTLINIG